MLSLRARLATQKGFSTSRTVLARSLCAEASEKGSNNKFRDGEQVDTVIIGGGVVGASVLYHLAEKGMKPILLEKGVLTCGSTWHAAGLVANFNAGTNLRRWHKYGVDFYTDVMERTGRGSSFQRPGSIRLIEDNADRIDEAKFQMGKSRFFDNPQELISVEEIKDLHPFVNTDRIWGGIWNTGDGHADPTSCTNAMLDLCKPWGARVVERCPVVALTQTKDRKWKVETDQGTIYADRVVNSGGLWGQKVARMAGVFMPSAIIQHQYVITDTIPEVEAYTKEKGHQIPVLRSLEGSYYLRQERNGILIGPYESKEAMCLQDEWNLTPNANDGAPYTFENDLFQPDLDRLADHLEHAAELFPLFAEAGISSVVNGPVQWACDGNALVGPVEDQGVYNFWQACGFSYGIAQGPGAGDYLARWITEGQPPYELFEVDPTRYGPWTTKFFTSAKVREAYGKNNNISFPKEELMAGRPVRTTPIYDRLKAKGAQWAFHNGLEQPTWFHQPLETDEETDPYQPSFRRTNWHNAVAKEIEITQQGMGIMDFSSFSKFIISVPKAFEFLDKLSANKIPAVGRVAIGHMLTKTGQIISEMTITRLSDTEFYIVTGSDMERHDLRHWNQHLWEWNMEQDVNIRSVTKEWTVLGIAGPNAEKVLQSLTTENMEPENFKFFSAKELDVGTEKSSSVPLVLRLSFTGLSGFEFHVPCDEMAVLYDNLWNAAAELGPVTDFGALALDSFRLEAGFKFLNPDMTRDYDALDSGIQKFVKMKNRNFVGMDAVKKQKKEGWASGKRCVKITVNTEENPVENRSPPEPYGDNVIFIKNDKGELKEVGFTTSGGYGHITKRSLAIAHIDLDQCVEGTKIQVEVLGQLYSGEVLEFI